MVCLTVRGRVPDFFQCSFSPDTFADYRTQPGKADRPQFVCAPMPSRANIIVQSTQRIDRKVKMRLLLIAIPCMLVVSGPALACRGTAEYPQAFQRLEKSTLSPEKRSELKQRLDKGQAIHDQGHRDDNKEKRRESLRILDAVTTELGK